MFPFFVIPTVHKQNHQALTAHMGNIEKHIEKMKRFTISLKKDFLMIKFCGNIDITVLE